MTSEHHNADAVIAALRSPALPAEQVGEEVAVTAMIEVLPTPTIGRLAGLRSRRGAAIAAVTVASLGLGGLAAAGPGIFQPAADTPPVTEPTTTLTAPGQDESGGTPDDGGEAAQQPDLAAVVAGTTEVDESEATTDEVECAEGNHGQTVSSIAHATESGPGKGAIVSEAARSDCGKKTADDTDESEPTADEVECAEGNHGQTVSSIAHATESGPGKGAIVSEAARSDCGKKTADDTDGSEATTDDDAPSDEGGEPADDAPGNSGNAPGRTKDKPGKNKPDN